MHPAKFLQLLNLKSPSLTRQSAGHNLWQWQDVAAALGMGQLSPLAIELGHAKYCEDDDSCQKLLQLMKEVAQQQAKVNKWRAHKNLLPRLAQLAVYEMLSSQLCKCCRGLGITKRGVTCTDCKGQGRQPLRAAERYHFAGIDKRNWERRWQSRYEVVYGCLCDAESQLLSHLSWQLNDGSTAK